MRTLSTPWGQPDHVDHVAPGIDFYSTPSHGGYHLDLERQAHVKRTLPTFRPFAGAPWYEEDCDAAVVVLMFPEAFPGRRESAAEAVRMFAAWPSGSRYLPVVAWLDGKQAPRPDYREPEYCGAFDGCNVISDADPGL